MGAAPWPSLLNTYAVKLRPLPASFIDWLGNWSEMDGRGWFAMAGAQQMEGHATCLVLTHATTQQNKFGTTEDRVCYDRPAYNDAHEPQSSVPQSLYLNGTSLRCPNPGARSQPRMLGQEEWGC